MAKIYARPYRRPQGHRGRMNRAEYAYSLHLAARQGAGEVVAYYFEAVKLRLADRTWLTPDFLVITPECLEFHEWKGHWEDDARVKWKVAAEQFPWAKFVAVTRGKRGELVTEVYGGGR